MRYQPLDEEVDDEPIEAPVDVEPVAPKDLGDFSREFLGVTVWFRYPKPFQATALSRLRESFRQKVRAIQATTESDQVKFRKLMDLNWDFDSMCIELIESILVNPDDADILARAQLRGELTPQQIIAKVLFETADEVDDDEDPQPKVAKKAKPARAVKKATAAKKSVASAGRTRR